jgi:DsbC/DsbD-like thiol-disulfide interchange protein/cytochrome c biogenesis protein CcdA
MLGRALILLALLLAPASALARGIEPQLIAEGPAPAGGQVDLAIHMRPVKGWHGYWLNPGDAGLPMDVQWQLPPGFAAGPLRYPVPTRLTVAGLMNYVYERDYAVLVRLKVPVDAKGTIPVRAEARWLACTDKVCVPEQGRLSLDLPVGSGTPNRAEFDAWRRALPRPLATPGRFEVAGDKLRIAIPLPADVEVGKPYLFPATDGAVDYEAPQGFRRSGDSLIAELQRKGGVPVAFDGVVGLGDAGGFQFRAIPGPVPQGGRRVGDLGAVAILWAVAGALVGGLLLNLMPCVFPILTLKALHLARAGGEAARARTDALGYAAGAIVGTGTLGLTLLAIRTAGAQAGWAFQLQDPRTILLLLLLTTAITLNLLRLYELPVVAGSDLVTGSFGTGALAALVATPCAGPFLGAALGTALLLPPAGSVLVFAALGLGLALPFLAIAFIPALRARLPRPGPWMVRLQRFLAIPMAATAVACLWLLWRLGGAGALEIGLVTAAIFSLLLIGAGLLQRKGKQTGYATTLVALAVAGASVWALSQRPATAAHSIAGAETWNEGRVQAEIAAGHPVFVYFTADWCLTCKANEAAAIDRSEVRDAFREAGVRVLAGDWTNGDPAITRFLEGRGRAGVPLYLWYAPGKPPEELPQILTPGMLISRAQQVKR